jgi:hypothetical protein
VALLNVKQYYDPLLKQLDAAHADGFMSDADRNLISASNDPTEVRVLSITTRSYSCCFGMPSLILDLCSYVLLPRGIVVRLWRRCAAV